MPAHLARVCNKFVVAAHASFLHQSLPRLHWWILQVHLSEAALVWAHLRRALAILTASDWASFQLQGGYDLLVGTSERGSVCEAKKLKLPKFRHALIAFGGPKGLEDAAAKDPALQGRLADQLFGAWINTCPGQGSRTIRTEEAILLSMGFLQSAIRSAASA